MKDWLNKIRKVDPYIPGEQPQGDDIIKLNTNENPYPPSPKVIEAVSGFDASSYSRYPDPTSADLVNALADYHGVSADQIFVGTGSDDVLAMAFLTFFNSEREVVFPDITYSFYPVWANVYRIPYREIPLNDSFRINISDYIPNSDDKGRFGGIVIANPNAPTGIDISLSEIEKIVSNNPDCIVIIDEAYIDYGGQTALPLISKYDNILIVRTYSKSRAMAGARIGYAIGSKELINPLYAVAQSVNSYTMTAQSLVAGVASISDDEYFRARINDIIRTRQNTISELEKRGFSVLTSSTNFVFAKPSAISARELFALLRDNKIYVRYFDAPRTKDYLRITIGTDDQMARVFEVLDGRLM